MLDCVRLDLSGFLPQMSMLVRDADACRHQRHSTDATINLPATRSSTAALEVIMPHALQAKYNSFSVAGRFPSGQ
eukprot:1050911-Amphidinium_carterae.1